MDGVDRAGREHNLDERSEPIEFREIFRALSSADVASRRDAAHLLSGMRMPLAIRPLVVAYVAHGDPELLGALRHFGRDVTRVVRAEAREPSVGGEQLARLLAIVGEVGDAGGLDLARAHAHHPSEAVRAAAASAMARLGDTKGIDLLWAVLERPNAAERIGALRALEAIDSPQAREALRAHADRYLAAAGAIPANVRVFAPLLLHREAGLARLLAERLAESDDNLHLAIGPAAGAIAEHHRGIIAQATQRWRTFYTTPRHRPDEQMEIAERARDAARAVDGRGSGDRGGDGRSRDSRGTDARASGHRAGDGWVGDSGASGGRASGGRARDGGVGDSGASGGRASGGRGGGDRKVLLLGPLPSPEGVYPLRHFLIWLPANPYTVRLLFLGPQDHSRVMEWWRYIEDVAEVPVAMEVILDLLTLDGDRITEEEGIIRRLVPDDDRERFHRALLAHL